MKPVSGGNSRAVAVTVAAVVLMVSALPSLVGASDPDDTRPEFEGTPPSSSKPYEGTIEEQEAKRKVERGAPGAVERRRASRRAFRGLSKDEARALARRKFPTLFEAFPPVLDLKPGERVTGYKDDFSALIENDDGKRGLALSTLPLRVKDDDGQKKRPNLNLVERDGGFEPANALMGARISKQADGGFSFEGTGVSVKPVVDASASSGTEVNGKVFYSNVRPDSDLAITATPTGLETFSILRSEDSPEKQAFDFSLPEGARLAIRGTPEGEDPAPTGAKQFVAVLDEDGKPIVSVMPPMASDADGEPVPVGYDIEGNRLTVQAEHRGKDFEYPIQVDPFYDVREDFWSWYEYPGGWDPDFYGWWFNVVQNANPPCNWNNHTGSQWWNNDRWGLYGWLHSNQWCLDGDWGEWLWRAPRNSRVFRVDHGYIRHWARYSCVEQGVWSVTRNWWDGQTWSSCNELTSSFTTLCMAGPYCENWGGTAGNVIVHKLRLQYDGYRTEAPITYLGGVMIYLQDDDNPVWETINHNPPGGWVEDGYHELMPRAHDDGLGMEGFEFYAPGHPNDGVGNDCWSARCPHGWQPANGEGFAYDIDLLPEGANTLRVRAFDALQKSSDTTFLVHVDRTPPVVSRSGAASVANTRLTDGRHRVHVDASDGSGANDASKRSGMKKIEIQVDGRNAGPGSSVNCSGYACAIDWDFVAERYADGQHTISAIATDQMNHVTRQDWEVKVVHAATTDVGPGAVNLKTGNFSVSHEDASIDASGQGLAVSRTYNSRDVAAGAAGPFGPGWQSSLPVAGPGADFVSLNDLTATSDNTAEVTTSDGVNLAFTRDPNTGQFVPPPGFEELKLTRREMANKVSHWKLGETSGNQARDSKGSNHGTYNGAIALNQPGLIPGGDKAVRMDGGTSYVSVPAASFDHARNASFSVELWYTPPNPTELAPLFTADSGSGGTRNDFYLFATATGQVQIGFFNEDLYTAAGVLTAGTPAHIVATYDAAADVSRIYVNGVERASGSLGPLNNVASISPKIGGWIATPWWADYYGKGTYDEVATYSRALSASEVNQLKSSEGVTWELTDPEGNTTVFERNALSTAYVAKRVREAGTNTTSTFEYDAQSRLTRAVAPAPTGVDCTTLVRGCRALTLVYASSTTATGTTPGTFGDYNGRVARVDLTAYDPASSSMVTTAVAQYLYDSNGRLREQWDPRISPALKTTYAYDTAGHMTALTPPGQEAWTLAYAAYGSDPDTGRLRSVSRNALPGTATWTVQYGVPVSGTGAPYAMGSSSVAAWGQTNVPSEATAIFRPDDVPANPPASYAKATVHYLDADGREVNVASPGGRISTTEYESHDKVRRELTPGNRQRALDAGASSATRAAELDTQYTYNADATELTQELGPMHSVELGNGQVVNARRYTRTTYDEAAPSGGPYHLPTTVRTGARYNGADYDERVTKIAYDGQSNLGWTLRQPTSKTQDAVTGGLNLRTVTLYDAATGNVTETRMPANPNGGDARSTQTLYYAAGAHADAACANRPEWHGLECKSKPAAQPGTAGMPDLPVTVTTYNRLNQPATETETVAASTRSTTTSYDAAGRKTSETTTSSVGTAVPATTTTYNASNGQMATTSATDGITRTITRAYDTLGRITSYTDADNQVSTTTYDLLGRPVTTNDGKGSQTRSYDSTTGDLTSLQDSAAGAFTATYDRDGAMATQDLPNGLRKRYTYDESGQLKQLKYDKVTNCTTGCTWLDFTGTKSIHGQWVTTGGTANWPGSTPPNPQAARRYTYDRTGRLTQTRDTPAAAGNGCTVRAYAFDADSNRTSRTTYAPGTDGACQTTTSSSTQTHAYDAADRQIDAGIVYDDFGRETALPASHAGGHALAMTYYADDQTRSLSQNGITKTYSLDPMRRQRHIQTVGGDGTTKTMHYSDDSDNPSWIQETSDGMSWRRQIEGIDGELTAVHEATMGTTLTLTNLQGDVIAHASLSSTATGPTASFRNDEFGNPQSGSWLRYGYLGGAQRRTELPTGIIQMGVRTYVPAIGRFTATDPVPGGSANDYDYANADPVNNRDLDGRLTTADCRAHARVPDRPKVGPFYRVRAKAWGKCTGGKGLNDPIKNVHIVVCADVYSHKRHRWIRKRCRGKRIKYYDEKVGVITTYRCKLRRPLRRWRSRTWVTVQYKDGHIRKSDEVFKSQWLLC